MERVREGIGSKFSMITQYVSTLFTGIVIGLCVNWRLTSIILCVMPFLVAVSGALAMVKYLIFNSVQWKYILFCYRFQQAQPLESKSNMV